MESRLLKEAELRGVRPGGDVGAGRIVLRDGDGEAGGSPEIAVESPLPSTPGPKTTALSHYEGRLLRIASRLESLGNPFARMRIRRSW